MTQTRWRIADEDLDASALPDVANLYYYDAMWRLLEERVRGDFGGGATWANTAPDSGDLMKITQRFWCLHYIDDLLAWQTQDEEPDGAFQDGDALFYALTDRLYSVIGVMDGVGADYTLIERVRYTAYGSARHIPFSLGDANGDGFVTFADFSIVLARYGDEYEDEMCAYTPDGDFGLDGEIDFDDYTLVLGFAGQGLPEGALSLPEVGNTIGYTGHHFDPATGMTLARFRWLEHDLGRWVNRDPAQYVNGMSLYQAVASSPARYLDPLGLWCVDDKGNIQREECDEWDELTPFFPHSSPNDHATDDAFVSPSRVTNTIDDYRRFHRMRAQNAYRQISIHCTDVDLEGFAAQFPSLIRSFLLTAADVFVPIWGAEEAHARMVAKVYAPDHSARTARSLRQPISMRLAMAKGLGVVGAGFAVVEIGQHVNNDEWEEAIRGAGVLGLSFGAGFMAGGPGVIAAGGAIIGTELIILRYEAKLNRINNASSQRMCAYYKDLFLESTHGLEKAAALEDYFHGWFGSLKPCRNSP